MSLKGKTSCCCLTVITLAYSRIIVGLKKPIDDVVELQAANNSSIGLLCDLVVREDSALSQNTIIQNTESFHCLVIREKDLTSRKWSDMAKRPAEESLEDITHSNSPSSKKPRVHFISTIETVPPNAPDSSNLQPTSTNGYEQGRENGHVTANDGQDLEESGEHSPSSDSEEHESAFSAPSRQAAPLEGYTDLYLDTINRSVLDFDFEKLCSVTLSNINIYACLICGKYFQGRGPKSHAYFHALEIGHHVYVNMQTKKVYVLPEGYEVKSKSLEDIKFVVDPRLSKDEVAKLDKESRDASDLSGKKYRPGLNH